MTEREFEVIQHQLSSLRRENRFLKVGLIFCLVLSTLPYLAGFQPETISAKRVVTEKVEFLRDGKTVMSITTGSKGYGLVILDKGFLPTAWVSREEDGGVVGVYNIFGKPVAAMGALPDGGVIGVSNKDGKPVAEISAQPYGGGIGVTNNDGKPVAAISAKSDGGVMSVFNKDGKPVAEISAQPYGGVMRVANNDSKPVAGIVAKPDGGKIVILTPSGRTVWSAP